MHHTFTFLLFIIFVVLVVYKYRNFQTNYENNLTPIKDTVQQYDITKFLKQLNVLYFYNPLQYAQFMKDFYAFFVTYNNRKNNPIHAFSLMEQYKYDAIECIRSITYSISDVNKIKFVSNYIDKLNNIFDMYLNTISLVNNKNVVKPFNLFEIDPCCAIFNL